MVLQFDQNRRPQETTDTVKTTGYDKAVLEDFVELAHKGVSQSLFTTIEFGYSPYVPLSEQYIMDFYNAGDGRVLTAVDGPEEAKWLKGIDRWQVANKISLSENIENDLPETVIKLKAEELGRTLSRLLEEEGVTPQYSTEHRGEIEDQAIARYIFETGKPKSSKFLYDILEDFDSEGRAQTFDLYAKDEPSRKALDMSLQMMSSIFTESQLKGVKAIETTNMTRAKHYLPTDARDRPGVDASAKQIEKWWKDQVTNSYNAVLKKYMKVGGSSLDSMLKSIGSAPKPSGPDTLAYAAKQMVYRFQDLLANSQLGGAFAIQAPITKYHAGYGIIKPKYGGKDGRNLIGVKIHTAIIGGSEFQTLIDNNADVGIFKPYGSMAYYGSHGQILLYWAEKNRYITESQLATITAKSNVDVVNRLALKSERDDIYAMAISTQIGASIGGAIDAMPTVAAIEVVTSQDAAIIVENQIKAFFSDPGMQDELAAFYKDALRGSGKVTDAWKGTLQNKGANTEGALKWRGEKNLQPFGVGPTAPYISPQTLEGIGLPFWLTFGRKEGAYQNFRGRYVKKAKYIKRKLIDPRSIMLVKQSRKKLSTVIGTPRSMNPRGLQ